MPLLLGQAYNVPFNPPAAAPPAGGQDFSDDFNRASGLTNWNDHSQPEITTIAIDSSVQLKATSSSTYDNMVMTWTTETDTVDQYCVVCMADAQASGGTGCILRASETNGYLYNINSRKGTDTRWEYNTSHYTYAGVIATSTSYMTDGNCMWVTITGTSTDTVVEVWFEAAPPTDPDPSTWVAEGGAANESWTADPPAQAERDSNVGIGISCNTGGSKGCQADNWYGGDQ